MKRILYFSLIIKLTLLITVQTVYAKDSDYNANQDTVQINPQKILDISHGFVKCINNFIKNKKIKCYLGVADFAGYNLISLGLNNESFSESILNGLNYLCKPFGKVIIFEDKSKKKFDFSSVTQLSPIDKHIDDIWNSRLNEEKIIEHIEKCPFCSGIALSLIQKENPDFDLNSIKVERDIVFELVSNLDATQTDPMILKVNWQGALYSPNMPNLTLGLVWFDGISYQATLNIKNIEQVKLKQIELKLSCLNQEISLYTKIGISYEEGNYIELSYVKAKIFYEKAANDGDTEAQFRLGEMYYNARGIKKDFSQAMYWFKKAAEQFHPGAQMRLGDLYYNGHGVPESDSEAEAWYKKSIDGFLYKAQNGNIDAQLSLGYIYYYGKNKKKSDNLASRNSNFSNERNSVTKILSNLEGPQPELIPDYSEAAKWFQKAAAEGNAEAQTMIGILYFFGRGKPQDYSQAFYWIEKSAEQKLANAMSSIAYMYNNGLGALKNTVEADKWYKNAAKKYQQYAVQGDGNACFELACLYSEGYGLEKNYDEAIALFQKAAEQGCVEAQHRLGYLYQDSKIVMEDPFEAIRWYLMAAQQNYANSFFKLGEIYKNNQNVTTDPLMAQDWYQKALYWLRKAARHGDIDAFNTIGMMYYFGNGIDKNYSQAFKWIHEAAENGYSWGQYSLGMMYNNGEGVTQDYIEAKKWFQKAAIYGLADAQNELGFMYANGKGVQKDNVEAVKWYRKAAEQDHTVGQYNLATKYFDGHGTANDNSEAFKWYMKAAQKGNAPAQNMIGFMYDEGRGVKKNQKEAVKWYQKAADQNHLSGLYNLGDAYYCGNGVKKNFQEAAKLFHIAAEQGHANSQLSLGVMYHNGDGVEKNFAKSAKWFNRAEEQDREDARKAYKELMSALKTENLGKYDQLSIKNDCSERIKVALCYLSLYHEWITEGWWVVEPGEEISTGIMSIGKAIYYYAEGKNYKWSGTGDDGSLKLSIVSNRFRKIGEEKLNGDKSEEYFLKMKTGDSYKNWLKTFSCK